MFVIPGVVSHPGALIPPRRRDFFHEERETLNECRDSRMWVSPRRHSGGGFRRDTALLHGGAGVPGGGALGGGRQAGGAVGHRGRKLPGGIRGGQAGAGRGASRGSHPALRPADDRL